MYVYIYICIYGLCLGIQQLIIYFSWPNEVFVRNDTLWISDMAG